MGEARNRRRLDAKRNKDSFDILKAVRKLDDSDQLERDIAEAVKAIPAAKLIEAARVSRETKTEGFAGRLNIYVCEECRGHVVTKDLTDGVTPFMIPCQGKDGLLCQAGCRGLMKSSMYRVFDNNMRNSHEWYYPDDLQDVRPQLMDHVTRGGLLLRKSDDA